MSPQSWQQYGRTIRVEGGIKARSKRGAIGEQWWSKRFIKVLESYGLSGRLARGRGYARAGQVLEFDLRQGMVSASVQGSRPTPYKVSIGVLPLTEAQWRRVRARLASQALFRAKLLAGEMPPEIEEVFDACGTPLFPASMADLDMRCNCPDWEVPCKHLAAVCYVLAEAFDNDPFGMLAWRGQSRDELLTALRAVGKPMPAGQPATPAEPTAFAVSGPPLAQCIADYWSPGLSQARLRALPKRAASAPDLLLRMFEPPRIRVRGKDLRILLAPAYEQLAADDQSASLRGPYPPHGLRQAPPAKRGQPVVGVDRADDAPRHRHRQEQAFHA